MVHRAGCSEVLDQLIFNLDDFEGWLPDGHQKFAHALTLVIGAQI